MDVPMLSRWTSGLFGCAMALAIPSVTYVTNGWFARYADPPTPRRARSIRGKQIHHHLDLISTVV
jgi:hypothetical protein